MIYRDQGELDKALEYYHASLDIKKITLGGQHADVASTYKDLAHVYDDHGELDKSVEYSQKSVYILRGRKTIPKW